MCRVDCVFIEEIRNFSVQLQKTDTGEKYNSQFLMFIGCNIQSCVCRDEVYSPNFHVDSCVLFVSRCVTAGKTMNWS